MHHSKSSRPKYVRSAMIPAVLLCMTLSGCADQQPTGPRLPRVALTSDLARDAVPFNKFFVAWSQSFGGGPIQTQSFILDTRQNRQFGGWWPDEKLLSFASANPGRLYINGDEPDQYCMDPYEYAGMYKHFVGAVRGADPTARFSPAGFAEPNDRCCPVPADEPCRSRSHSIGYAEQFFDAYVRRYGVAPPVDEWRFHDFGLAFSTGDMNGWWSRVDKAAAWSVSHGANMVLGAWGFHGWKESTPAYQEHMKQAIGRLSKDTRINEAVYWSYESWAGEAHHLAHPDGSLTPQGQTYANPLTDIPTALKIVGSANGQAKLRWSNTTSAWAAEVEFWVQAPGSDSFAYNRRELVAAPGASQTPVVVINSGGRVRARVRYSNAFGEAPWSSFSNTVLLASAGPEADPRGGVGKRPLLCLLRLC